MDESLVENPMKVDVDIFGGFIGIELIVSKSYTLNILRC